MDIKNACLVTLEDIKMDSRILGLNTQMDNLNASLAAIEAKYATKPPVAPTDEEQAEAIQSTQVEINSLLFTLDSLLNPLITRRNMLDSISNGIVDSFLLGVVDALKCVPSGRPEHTEIVSVMTVDKQLKAVISVSQLEDPVLFYQVIPVPFLLGNTSYILDLEAALLFETSTGRLLDQRKCTQMGEFVLICPTIRTRKHACLTSAWDDETLIPKACDFKKMKYEDDAYILRQNEGTLVAQLSEEDVVVSYKDKAIRYNPVFVTHEDKLKVSVDGDTVYIEGTPGADFTVHHSSLSHNQLLKNIDPKTYYLRKLIPDSYSDYAYVVLAVAVALLFLPHLYSLIKCLFVCCGILEKRRGTNRWYLPRNYEYTRRARQRSHRHNIEDHYSDSDCSEPIRERLAMLPLHSIPPAQERRVLNNVLHDARTMNLNQFLRRYIEPRQELVEFYGLVNSREMTRSRTRRLN